jgi:hypothetical protein
MGWPGRAPALQDVKSCGGIKKHSRIIARFQSLLTESLSAKRLGQPRPELIDELYQTSLELERRGLKIKPRVPKRHADGRSASWVARRVGEAQQPRSRLAHSHTAVTADNNISRGDQALQGC